VSEFTELLERAAQSDANVSKELLPLVYDELRKLAAHKLAHEAPGQTLQPTALVHEAWLRLAGSSHQQWNSRGHFFGAAAEAMRRILIDNARRKGRVRHGGRLSRVDLDKIDLAAEDQTETLLAVNDALTKFAALEPTKAELVKLRFFVGLTMPDAGKALGLSESTAKRHWDFARAWLYRELSSERGLTLDDSH
jgi:RNA polymerase sigma factor (TIGR02999 family)